MKQYIDITKNQPVGENGLQVCFERNSGRVGMFTFLLCPKKTKTINLRLKSEGESAQRRSAWAHKIGRGVPYVSVTLDLQRSGVTPQPASTLYDSG